MSFLSWLEWILGFLCQLLISWDMRNRYLNRRYPVFYTWITFEWVKTIPLFLLFMFQFQNIYFWTYMASQFVGYALEIGIAGELFYRLLRPKVLLKNEPTTLLDGAVLLFVLIASLLVWVNPSTHATDLYALGASLNHGIALLLCSVFVLLLLAAWVLHLGWHGVALGLASGFGIYAGVELVTETILREYGRRGTMFVHVHHAFYFFAVYIWIAAIARTAPEITVSRELLIEALSRMKHLLDSDAREISRLRER